MRCLGKILTVLMISVFLFGCQLYEEKGETFVPFEEIVVEEGEVAVATLDSLQEKVNLEVKGLPVLDEGQIYEAWLVDKDIDLKISVGTFNVDEDGSYSLNIDVVKEDILDTDSVMITLEPVPDEDSGPSEDIVLQGDTGGVADVMSVKLEFVGEESDILLPEDIMELELPEEFEEIEEFIEIEVPEEFEEVEEEAPEEAAYAEVKILTRSLEPKQLIITEGTTVKFVNDAENIHILGGAVKSPKLEKGDSFQHIFDEIGEYSIIDIISKVRINIVVKEASKEAGEEKEETEEEEVTVEVEEVPEEAEEEPVKETDAIIVIVQETEKVSLRTTASDPDTDRLDYAYSSPLDTNGEWKTTYGDAGEYTATVTVSDGKLSASEDVLIIVNKKEEAPVLDEYSPLDLNLKTDENTKLEFSASASDINKDDLKYSWTLDGKEISTTKRAVYNIGYDDAGAHKLVLEITDGTSTIGKEWKITVINVNRPPVLNAIPAIKVKETETVNIEPKASDPDGDALSYTISDPVGDDGEWKTTHDDAGEYNILVTVTDGVDSDVQETKVTVENLNRPPVIEGIVNKE